MEKLKVYRREVDHETESEKVKDCCVGASNERWRIGESATKDDFPSIPKTAAGNGPRRVPTNIEVFPDEGIHA
jgi:hypothetical protein